MPRAGSSHLRGVAAWSPDVPGLSPSVRTGQEHFCLLRAGHRRRQRPTDLLFRQPDHGAGGEGGGGAEEVHRLVRCVVYFRRWELERFVYGFLGFGERALWVYGGGGDGRFGAGTGRVQIVLDGRWAVVFQIVRGFGGADVTPVCSTTAHGGHRQSDQGQNPHHGRQDKDQRAGRDHLGARHCGGPRRQRWKRPVTCGSVESLPTDAAVLQGAPNLRSWGSHTIAVVAGRAFTGRSGETDRAVTE